MMEFQSSIGMLVYCVQVVELATTSQESMPKAWTLGLPGALPPGPLGLHPSSQYVVYPTQQHIVHFTINHSNFNHKKLHHKKKFNEYQFYNSNPVSISLYTKFTVLPLSVIFNNTFSLFPDVH